MSENAIFFIAKVGNGSLFIGPRPQAHSLKKWARAIEAKNIHHVVSLIENSEIDHHQLGQEEATLNALQIAFTHFPIPDFQTPDPTTFSRLIAELSDRLSEHENLYLHCAGGIGRAGTTASCLMLKHGMSADEAMELVSTQRGEPSPETDEQASFVRSFQP